ncbi:class I tRNA ligase family protein [Streptomyces sp. H27-C3]|uniref:class I tRNA ligase family protein n=1 Tax=Streptomyces sp. H27-C3 TaxID=3046305 RepID=UPI0024B9F752|nr:class I tRNA ligase family protein [Streptomyces sp. H27-C3]MDJ0464889.1 class I tRNA ligase family protein [Streptomyces sp. H27-C3]
MSTPLWITATPPATHGELHVGHLAGPYVAADVLSRFLRADGQPVLFTAGTADHATSVELRALRAGRKPEEVAEGYYAAIAADWLRSGVEFDHIVRPRRDRGYSRWMQDLFGRLYAEGVIAARTRLLPHCEPCDRWLHGAHVTGRCPHCGAVSDGGMCRECARPNDCGDLITPTCALCGTVPRLRRCRRLYLPLEPFRERLADHWAAAELPPRLAALCESLVEDGLPDVAVGHPGDWGVPVPDVSGNGFPGHRIDACFEAAAMHLFGYGFDKKPLPEQTMHFCGFGHAFCHAVLLPAILLARGVKLPQDFCVNESYRIGGESVTNGKRHAVWALDLLTEYGSDTVRRHVIGARPQGRSTDFDRDRLAVARHVLDDTWNSWLSGLFAAVREECAGLVPAALPGGAGWEVQRRRLARAVQELREAYGPESFDPRRAVAVLDEVVRSAADFGHVNSHEGRRPGGGGRHLPPLVAQLTVACALAAWAGPVMPEGADRLADVLGVARGRAVDLDALAAPAPGTRLAPPTGPVFGF